jgi:GWxTD domain-containing protein
MKTFFTALALFSVVLTAQAGDLSKYRNWDNSPQGYFMTAAERAEWKSIQSDEAAGEFVNKFIARRGGDAFVAEVAKRADMADKYLSFGKNKGSAALRGKLVILFGPPSNIAVSMAATKGGGSNGLDSSVMNNVGSSGGGIAGDGGSDPNAIGRGGSSHVLKIYTFTFSGKTTASLGQNEYVSVVEVDTGNGKDRLKDGRKQDELQGLFEKAAAASIKQ